MFLFIKKRKSNLYHFKHLNIKYEMDPALFVLHLLAPAVTQIMCSGVGQLRSQAQPLRGFSPLAWAPDLELSGLVPLVVSLSIRQVHRLWWENRLVGPWADLSQVSCGSWHLALESDLSPAVSFFIKSLDTSICLAACFLICKRFPFLPLHSNARSVKAGFTCTSFFFFL